MEPGFLAAVDILVNHYLPEFEFARKSAPNQLGLFGEDELAAAVAPKSRTRNLRKPAKGQMAFNWDEDSHPREATAHDGKRPGEFAPKEDAEAAKVAAMYPSLKDDVKPEPEEEEQPEPEPVATHAEPEPIVHNGHQIEPRVSKSSDGTDEHYAHWKKNGSWEAGVTNSHGSREEAIESAKAMIDESNEPKQPANPFREEADRIRAKADQLAGGTAHDKAMASAFVLGTGRPGNASSRRTSRQAEKRIDASIDRALKATELYGKAKSVEAKAAAFDNGQIDANGNPTEKAVAASEARKTAADGAKQQIADYLKGTLKPGDLIDIGGNGPVAVQKVNKTSVTSEGGSKWKFGEITPTENGKPIPRSEFAKRVNAFHASKDQPAAEAAPNPITEQFPSLKGFTEEPKPAEPEPPKADEQSGPLTLAKLDERKERINTGKATADEVRQWHKELSDPANIEAIKAEFNKQSVAELKSKGGTGYYNRQKKADLIESVMDHIGDEYDVSPGGLSYVMSPGGSLMKSKQAALQKKLAGLTDQHIADHAAKLSGAAAKREEASEAVQEGIKNPQTLDDFRNAVRHYGGYANMPEDIQVAFDEFAANRRRETAAQSKAKVTGFSGGTEATGATSIVEGHHQKKNAPTYTVTVEKHLGDGWGDALSRARQLGGSYVNGWTAKAYKATPGFQFFNRADAEKFQKSLGGEEVDRSDRLDEKNISRMDNASERLAALSEATKKRAEEKLNAPRQTNTHRRAEHAAGAQAQARSEAAKAETMQRISEGLSSGSLKHLGGIRARTHVDTLDSLLHSAKLNAWRGSGSTSQDSYEEMRERDATSQDIAKAKYPYPRIWDHELAEHLDELSQIPGLKNIARDLKKSTEKSPYKKKIGKISINGGEAKTADQLADIPLARGLVKDKAVRIHVSQDSALLKGRHPVAYTADGGKTWGTTQDIAVSAAVHGEINGTSKLDLIDPPQHEQVEIKDPDTIASIQKAIRILKRKSNPRLKRVAESLGQHMEDYNRLQGMDITTPMELRAALREYAPLKKRQDKEDPVKAKERSLVGRKIDGFFPTPRPAIDKMLAAADIQPGMSVLEPSAGKGDILDAVKEQHPDAKTIGIETNSDLRDLIGMKGHELHDDTDFLQHSGQYDRIVMNPPFENRADVSHVQHAFKNIKPGGRLVAIMGAGVFGGSSKKDQEFRDWLDEHGGEVEDMPEGSFNGADAFRKTGVNTRMVVIDKPHDAKQFSRDLAFVLSRI
ncbi:AdoMet_MTases domain containing protein [uncultured Caudovirales phage]|uniref:AdoMet_MTases domain containing protein n=1 Tax=uncultured Caudovirales phage TaxID=2100421 RepID=A0A6J5RJE4_9CAUD|nr:AdoMet_MTases domain containing protein [uncultured Caudovirales phage]